MVFSSLVFLLGFLPALLLVYFLFFAEFFGRTDAALREDYAYNLEPFKEISRFWTYWHPDVRLPFICMHC